MTTILEVWIAFGSCVELNGAIRFEVTPEYSGAVERVLLPEFSDFVRHLGLPIELPLARKSIERFACNNRVGDVGGVLYLTNGSYLAYEDGHVDLYETTNSYFTLQNPDEIPRFYGAVRLSRSEAIRVARDTIQRLGHSLESVFAELEPEVQGPTRSNADRGKMIPHYLVTWTSPEGASRSARIEIDGENGEVTRIYFSNRNLNRPPPKVGVPEPTSSTDSRLNENLPPINPEYIRNLRPLSLNAANKFLRKTGLGAGDLTTNSVARFDHVLEPTGVDTLITLTNGLTFVYKFDRITRYKAPGAFSTANRPYLIADFKGPWNVTDEEAVKRARSSESSKSP